MFKFKIIERKNLSEYKQEQDINALNFLQEDNIVLKNSETSTLLITDAMEQDTIGRLALTQRELNHLQEEIRSLIPTSIDQEYIWECSALSFPSPHELSCSSSSCDQISRHFFHTLYEGIVAFGTQKDIGFVGVKFNAESYLPTKEFGLWPYVLEFHPDEFPENFFYGILPLKGNLYEEYKKRWAEFNG